MSGTVSEVIKLVVTGGIGTLVAFLVNAYRTTREVNDKSRDNVVRRWRELLEEARTELTDVKAENQYLERLADHWRSRAAELEYLCGTKGIEMTARQQEPRRTADLADLEVKRHAR